MENMKTPQATSNHTEDPMIYPGLAGGVFERTITLLEKVERIPSVLFFLLLGLLAYLLRPGTGAIVLGAFFAIDFLIILSLPRARVSFGPAKPQTLLLALLRAPFALLPLPWWWIMQCVGTVLVIYAFRVEPARIRLIEQRVDLSRGLGTSKLRIFHFGDLHIERTTARDKQVLEWIREHKPDLILYSGDVFSYSNVHDPVAHAQVLDLMEKIEAPLGAYAVLGSPPVDVPEVVVPLYEQLPVTLLQDENVYLKHSGTNVCLIGLTCSHNPEKDAVNLNRLTPEHETSVTILLYHSPDLAPSAAEAGIDIQFSGHTHGGQVRVPLYGAIFTSSLFGKRFESGRYQVDDLTLYVTRGIGLEGRGAPRVRFLCPPECTLWEVTY